MKNLKKVLVTVLALAMILTVGVYATANYPDVSDDASYVEATDMLKYLGIMEGDENGDFRPDADLTRAEATTIICRAKGLESAAEGAKGATQFTDVSADHWATGYINLGQQSGIINGYGDGTFGPEDAVTYEQAIKMVVAALGYTPMAEQNGGYPSGYLVVASQKGLTKGVSGTAGQALSRANMAQLTYNALDVYLMEQVSWNPTDPEYAIMDGTGNYGAKTLLTEALDIDKYEGYITGTYLTNGSTDAEDKSINVNYYKLNGEQLGYTDHATFQAIDGVDAASYFGQNVIVYVQENELTGDEEIVAITAKAAKNVSLVLNANQVLAFEKEATNNGSLQYSITGSTKSKQTIKLDKSGVGYYYNGKEDEVNATDWLERAENAPVRGYVEVLDQNNDKLYDYVMVTEYNADYVVDEIEAETSTLIDIDEADIPIDIEDENKIVKFYNADGAEIAFEDIAVGDILTIAESHDTSLISVYVSKNVVNGTITEKGIVNDEIVFTVEGEDYPSDVAVAVNDSGLFYVSVDNRIVYKDATSSRSENYGYLYDAAVESGIGGAKLEIKFLNKDNEWKTATVAKKVTTWLGNNVENKKEIVVTTGKVSSLYFYDFVDVTYNTTSKKYDVAVNRQLFQYEMNTAGEIDKIYLAGSGKDKDYFALATSEDSASYKAASNRLGKSYLADDTVVFCVAAKRAEASTASLEEDDITIGQASSLFVDEEEYEYDAYDYDTAAGAVVVYGYNTKIQPETQLLVVTKVAMTSIDGTEQIKIYGLQSGEAVSALIAEDGCIFTDRDGAKIDGKIAPEAGDVVIFSLDSNGDFNNMQILMGIDEAVSNIVNGTAVNEYNVLDETCDVFGFAAKRQNGQIMLTANQDDFKADPKVFLTEKDATNNDTGIELAVAPGRANVYEINLTAGLKKLTVSKIAASGIRVGQTNADTDCYFAYIRQYDGEVVDMVVYRLTNAAAN